MTKSNKKLSISSFSSSGRSHKILGVKKQKMHTFFSDLEFKYFLLLEYSDNVVEIHDQVYLDIDETQIIAGRLGFKHPQNTAGFHQMSTDFLVRLNDRMIARNVKPSKKINKRMWEKFKIEQAYWKKRGIECKIITEQQLPETLTSNLIFFRNYYKVDVPDYLLLPVLSEFILLWDEDLRFAELVQLVSDSLNLPYAQCYQIILHHLYHKKLRFNHTYKFSDNLLLKFSQCHVSGYHQQSNVHQ
jgi:hypothetical protein